MATPIPKTKDERIAEITQPLQPKQELMEMAEKQPLESTKPFIRKEASEAWARFTDRIKSWEITEENIWAVNDAYKEKYWISITDYKNEQDAKAALDATKTEEPVKTDVTEPVVDTKIEETTKTETTEGQTFNKIDNIDEFKQRWGWLENLDQFVEDRYGTIAEVKNWKVTATIWDEKFEWSINEQGNPVKVSLGKVWETWETTFKQALLVWVDKTNPNYEKLQGRVDQYKAYERLNDSQLQSALWQGILLPWTQAYSDLMWDPLQSERIKKLTELNTIKWEGSINEEVVFETVSTEIWNSNKVVVDWQEVTLWTALSDWSISRAEYNAMTNTPEITAKYQEVQDKKDKVAELQAEYDAVEDQVKEELKWTAAWTAAMKQLVYNRKKAILWPLNLAITQANNAVGTLTQLKADSTELFTTNYNLFQQEAGRQETLRQEGLQLASQDRAFDFQKEQFEYNKAQDKLARENQWIATSFLKDPATGKTALVNTQTWEIIKSYDTGLASSASWTSKWTKLDDNTLYNTTTGQTRTTSKDTSMDQYRVTQDYGATSPNAIDNVRLADGQVWTPWVDYAMPVWTDVKSFVNWTVTSIKEAWDYWLQAIVTDKQGNRHMYNHLSEWILSEWDTVAKWDVIALSGSSWFSTWPHLDYRVRGTNNEWLNPNDYTASEEITITGWYDKNKLPQYRAFIEDDKIPTGMKFGTPEYERFVKDANEWYNANAAQIFKEKWFNISNKEAFNALSSADRKKLSTDIDVFGAFNQSMDKLIWYAEKYWTKTLPWTTKRLIEQEHKNALLQAKELFNLWVLNWPDLELMEDVIPSITAGKNPFKWFFTNEVKLMRGAKQTVLDNTKATLRNKWISIGWDGTTTIWADASDEDILNFLNQ